MWPFGHLAVGYLLYIGIRIVDSRVPVQMSTLVVLAFGTQLPDLIDKPFGFWGVLPSGRSLGHSAVVFAIALLLVEAGRWYLNQRRPTSPRSVRRSPKYVAGLVGYGSHLLADSYRELLAADVEAARYLLWPLKPVIEYPNDPVAPWTRLLTIDLTPAVRRQLALFGVAVGVFVWLRIRERGWRSLVSDDLWLR